MLLTPAQLDEFHLRGYVKGPRLLDDDAVDRLRDELQTVMEGRSAKAPLLNRNLNDPDNPYATPSAAAKKNLVVQIVNMWEVSKPFFDLCRNPALTATIARLCNNAESVRIWHDQVQFKPPVHGGPAGWHQDFPAWPVLQPADLVSAWIALDDAEIDNGCMWMVPGSHRWGTVRLQSGPNFEPLHDAAELPADAVVKTEPLIVKKGEVAFHHCMTWHGSPANRSERPRRAFAIHYMPGYTVYAPTRSHPVEKHIKSKPGEALSGEHFPLVYTRTRSA